MFLCIFVVVFILFPFLLPAQAIPIPKIDFNITEAQGPKEVSLSLQVLLLITLLSMAPAIILMLTSFTKIIIIFDFIKRALSLQNMPPNQVLVSLALFLTFFIMAPTFYKINERALTPYLEGKMKNDVFLNKQPYLLGNL